MYAAVSRGKDGMVDYLISGKRKDSIYTRNQKDNVRPIYGDLNISKKTETYLQKHKNFAHNYLHITLSFTSDEYMRLKLMRKRKRERILREIVKKYIEHHTTGYDQKHEVIAYGEAHEPRILEENGKERLFHIHLQIMNFNPVSDISLATAYANTCYMDNVLETYINKKYGFENPLASQENKSNADTLVNKVRNMIAKEVSHINDIDEFEAWLESMKLEFVKRGNKKSGYFLKLIDGDVNLKGRGFEQLTTLVSFGELEKNALKSVNELEQRLNTYYEERNLHVEKRKSKDTKRKLEQECGISLNTNMLIPWIIPKKYDLDQQLILFENIESYKVQKNVKNNSIEIVDEQKKVILESSHDAIKLHDNIEMEEGIRILMEVLKRRDINFIEISMVGSIEFMAKMTENVKHETLTNDNIDISLARPMSSLNQLKKDLGMPNRNKKKIGTGRGKGMR